MRGRKSTEEFRVSGVVERLTPYEGAEVDFREATRQIRILQRRRPSSP